MTPTLIALALLVIAVGVVAWLTHRRSRPTDPTPRIDSDQDTAWNDPVTPAPQHEPRPRP